MLRAVIIRFRFFRSFLIAGFVINGAALFFFKPFVSFVVAFLTLAFIVWCIRCVRCGKSPFVKWAGSSRIGIPIPERKCSKCGRDFFSDEPS
jgi:hypothetical protein